MCQKAIPFHFRVFGLLGKLEKKIYAQVCVLAKTRMDGISSSQRGNAHSIFWEILIIWGENGWEDVEPLGWARAITVNLSLFYFLFFKS